MSNRYASFITIAQAIHFFVEEERSIAPEEKGIPAPDADAATEQKKKDRSEKDAEMAAEPLASLAPEGPAIIDYAIGGEPFGGSLYAGKPLDYVELFYGGQQAPPLSASHSEEEGSSVSSFRSGAEPSFLSARDAEETIVEIQYAAALRNFEAVSYKEREKFALWCVFNPVMMRLFETIHGMTGDVNYSRTF